MTDVQNLTELCEVLVRNDVSGFDQFALDELYAELEEADSEESTFDTEEFTGRFERTKVALIAMEGGNQCVSEAAQPFVHLYSLWSLVALENLDSERAALFAPRYREFMDRVEAYDLGSEPAAEIQTEYAENKSDPAELSLIAAAPQEEAAGILSDAQRLSRLVRRYKLGSVGASTEPPQRRARLVALQGLLHHD